MKHKRRRPVWLKPKQPQLSPRTLTIARLIDRMTARTGNPTDQELASLLACSIEAIRRHRAILGR